MIGGERVQASFPLCDLHEARCTVFLGDLRTTLQRRKIRLPKAYPCRLYNIIFLTSDSRGEKTDSTFFWELFGMDVAGYMEFMAIFSFH